MLNAVEAKVRSGLYRNASGVVSEDLRAALAREQGRGWLGREAAIGFAQLEAKPWPSRPRNSFLAWSGAWHEPRPHGSGFGRSAIDQELHAGKLGEALQY